MIQSYRDLRVWRKGIAISEEVYRLCRKLPIEERYGIAQQMKRASVSIPTNVAEGYGRGYLGEYLRFISIANGSLKEVEALIFLSLRLRFFPSSDARSVLIATDHLGRMFTLLTRRLSLKAANRQSDVSPLLPTTYSPPPTDSSTHTTASPAPTPDSPSSRPPRPAPPAGRERS